MVGVVLLFWYALPLAPPGLTAVFSVPPGREAEVLQGSDAEVQRYHSLAHLGLVLVLIGTVLEALPPFCTALGSWWRRPVIPRVQTREQMEPQPGTVYNNSAAQGRPQMSTPPQTDTKGAQISTQTERVLHYFVRDAVQRLSQALKDAARQSAPTFEDSIRFERGDDGHFRERKTRIWTLWPTLSDEWLHSLPDYEKCVECLRSDELVGPHLDRLVGTSADSRSLHILTSLIYAMLDDEGSLTFTSEKFQSKW